ncbi:hypothetical protein SBA4_4730004 [Candidatus Sulfopaludibacter sp. SbA4]|nr:hypothetical protein SBA4_4730004 [Candidatus Sulfopaludibacter sp. SbA4]
MLRRVAAERTPVSRAAKEAGLSRPSFYQAQTALQQGGLVGLIPQKPGPRGAHKLTAPVLDFLERQRAAQPHSRYSELARQLQEKFGVPIHPRTIERMLSRRQKKTPLNDGASPGRPEAGELRERYEEMRERALARAAIGTGSDIVVHQGMRSWMEAGGAETGRLYRMQVERARYEAVLAERRYKRVDPDNRLVARTLEAEWNGKLRLVREAEQECERLQLASQAVSAQAREQILGLADDFPRIWQDPKTPARERKRMARLLLEDVTLIRDPEQITAHIRFKGGAQQTILVPIYRQRTGLPVNAFGINRTFCRQNVGPDGIRRGGWQPAPHPKVTGYSIRRPAGGRAGFRLLTPQLAKSGATRAKYSVTARSILARVMRMGRPSYSLMAFTSL